MRRNEFSRTLKHTRMTSGARRDVELIIERKKRTCNLVDLTTPADHPGKINKSVKIGKYVNLTPELKYSLENEGDSDISAIETIAKVLEEISKIWKSKEESRT